MAGLGSAIHGDAAGQNERASSAGGGGGVGGDGRIAEKGAAREKLPTAAYQTQQEQIKVSQLGKKGTVRALEEKRGSLRFLEYFFFPLHVLLHLILI